METQTFSRSPLEQGRVKLSILDNLRSFMGSGPALLVVRTYLSPVCFTTSSFVVTRDRRPFGTSEDEKRGREPFLLSGKVLHGCDHNPLERGVILRLVKEFFSSVAAIKGVENHFTRRDACSPGHRGTLYIDPIDPIKEKVRVPFCSFLDKRDYQAYLERLSRYRK